MPILLVLGATSGIGLATAREFARAGWSLQLAGRNIQKLQSIAAEFRPAPPCLAFDALDADSRSSLWSRLPCRPDALLCAVGHWGDQAAAQSDSTLALEIIESNFNGLLPVLTQAALSFEARGSGLIIGISSVAGDRGRASNYVYGAAKAGLTAYLSGLRARLARSGVHVLTVKPGYVSTRMLAGRRLPAFLVASPERVARDVFRAALRRRDVLYTPGWWRWLLAGYGVLPEGWAKRLRV